MDEVNKRLAEDAAAQSEQNLEANLLGGTTYSEQVKSQQENKVLADSAPFITNPLESSEGKVNTALGNTWMGGVAEWALRPSLAPDPNFNIESRIPELVKQFPEDYVRRLSDVQSEQELQYRLDDIRKEMDDQQMLAAGGFTGTAAQIIAVAADPTTYMPMGWSLMGKRAADVARIAGSGAARVAYGTVAGGEAALVQSTLDAATKATGDLDAIVSNTVGGMVLGGGFGKMGAFEQEANAAIQKAASEYRTPRNAGVAPDVPYKSGPDEDVDAPDAPKIPERPDYEQEMMPSLGAATVPAKYRSNVPDKKTSPAANKWVAWANKEMDNDAHLYREAENATRNSGAGQKVVNAIQKTGFLGTEFEELWNSGSNLAKVVAFKLYESASGTARNNSAAVLGDMYSGHVAAPITGQQRMFYKNWLAENKLQDSIDNFVQFNNAVREHQEAMWHSGASSTQSKAIQGFADAIDEASARARNIMNGQSGQNPVRGAANLPTEKGWMANRWSWDGFLRVMQKGATERDIVDALTDSYAAVHPKLNRDILQSWAKAVFNRARAIDGGIDTNLIRLLQGEGTTFAKEMLMNSGLSAKRAEDIIEALKLSAGDNRNIKPLRDRNEIDLRATIPNSGGMRLMDLVENDYGKTWASYSRTVGYSSGLARHGIQLDEMGEIADAIQEELRTIGAPLIRDASIDYLKRAFTGGATADINPWTRRLTSTSRLALLNGNQLTQLAELGNLVATYGFKTFMEGASDTVQRILNKGAESPAVQALAQWDARIAGESNIVRPELMLDDMKRTPEYKRNLTTLLDGLLIRGTKLQRFITGFDWVHKKQMELSAKMLLIQLGKWAKTGEGLSAARMYDIGFIEQKFANRLSDHFKTHVVYKTGSDLVEDLKLDKLSPQDQEQFMVIVNRAGSQAIQHLYRGESNALYHNDIGHLFTDLKSFTLGALSKQLARHAKIADPVTTATVLWSIAVGGLVYGAKEIISGRDPKVEPVELAKGAFGMAGITSPVAMLGDPVFAMLGMDNYNFSNYMRPGAAGGTILGVPPSIETVNRMLHIPESAMSIALGENDPKNVTALQAAPIIGNLPGFSFMFNKLKQSMEESRDAERKEAAQAAREEARAAKEAAKDEARLAKEAEKEAKKKEAKPNSATDKQPEEEQGTMSAITAALGF